MVEIVFNVDLPFCSREFMGKILNLRCKLVKMTAVFLSMIFHEPKSRHGQVMCKPTILKKTWANVLSSSLPWL